MSKSEPRKIAFPRYAEYNCAIKYLLEQGLGARCIVPPKLTRRTLELGARYSPDYACTPFKTLLGSMIECLEAGADTLMMVYPVSLSITAAVIATACFLSRKRMYAHVASVPRPAAEAGQ